MKEIIIQQIWLGEDDDKCKHVLFDGEKEIGELNQDDYEWISLDYPYTVEYNGELYKPVSIFEPKGLQKGDGMSLTYILQPVKRDYIIRLK